MVRSFLIKAGLLAVTAGLTIWVGWQGNDRFWDDPPAEDPEVESPLAAVVVPASSAPGPRSGRPAESHPVGPSPARTIITSASKTPAQSPPLDLNRATAEEFQNLPGIGAVLAQRMIARRQTRGLYHTIDDLKDVKGIGAKRLDRLRPLVMVGREQPALTTPRMRRGE